jgi:hypothetical protein
MLRTRIREGSGTSSPLVGDRPFGLNLLLVPCYTGRPIFETDL